MSRHPRIVNRHAHLRPELAAPQYLRLGTLVLLLITVNQIDEPLVDPSLHEVLLYWGARPLVLAGGLILADRFVARAFAGRLTRPEWLKPVVLVSALGLLPLAAAEAILELYLPIRTEFLDEELWAISPAVAFLGEFLTVASVVIPIHLLLWLIIDRNRPGTETTLGNPQPEPQFLSDNTNLTAAKVLALQAEEHYVRIYYPEGSELVHYRFRDAVDEMPDELGLRVHRSWWVADRAVQSAQRGSRRWQLTLENGVDVPVSDSFAAAARERGWLRRKPRA